MSKFSAIRNLFIEIKEQSEIAQQHVSKTHASILFDIMASLFVYGARPKDYTMFEFYNKNACERKKYLTLYKSFELAKKQKHILSEEISGDKIREYQIYKDFIHRDWMAINKDVSADCIKEFIVRNGVVIVKPNNGEQGNGVTKLDALDTDKIDDFLKIRKSGCFVIEECIQNERSVNEINPTSLNTVRCYTFIDNQGKVNILEIMLRTGRMGIHVDNWGSGGIGWVFDKETGVCSQYGLDKQNHKYQFHPDSGFCMIGYRLPHFDEFKNFILDLCTVLPDARFVGWDIAITPKGFELVEMNCPGGYDFLQAFGHPWGLFIKENW